MGVEWSGLCGSDLRDAVGCFERVGCGNYLYGSADRACTCSGDVNDAVGIGCGQDRCCDDHDYSAAAGGRGGKSHCCVGADRVTAKCCCNSDERYAE